MNLPSMDVELEKHCKHVSLLSGQIAKSMNLPESNIKLIKLAALYHDIGKTLIPATILNKPDSLTEDEFIFIQLHVTYGYYLLSTCDDDRLCSCKQYIMYHHENWDGTGYMGLQGGDIPLASRIIRIADVYSALMSDRPYRCAMSKDMAVETIKNESRKFDPYVLTVFLIYVLIVSAEVS